MKVGSQTLCENEYDTNVNRYGTLKKVTYGNGQTVENDYDNFSRITGVRFNGETTPRYKYTYNANGQVANVVDNDLGRVQQSEYDLANRPCRVKLHEGGSHVYTGEVEYDGARGNLAKFTEKVGTGFTKYETTFGYDNEDRPVTLSYGDTNNQTILTYDGLGRVTNRTVKVGGYSFNTIIGYTDGAYGTNSTTGLLRHMFQGNENFVYYYDNVGNISYMYRTGKYTGYVYDALGQLIRVNDQTDTTSGTTGTTWTYEYDRGGNIISKSRYAFTTGALGTALETVVYGYGDYNWMDKMTHYNYLGVSYDDIGNPTSFNGWTCTWEKGRQLKQMTDNSTNTIYYKYNADGLRVQKRKVTIYGGDVTTKYILHGKNIVHMTQGTDTLHFWYDAQGRPAIVEYNGTKYAYIQNLQGDIVGIIDSTGTEVVQYTYDAWGKVLSTAGTMASTLGTVQPFRYRGYVYDVETGLYYLRSRYYNPEWGRFINADVLIKGNLYCYCKNEPIKKNDPDGLYEWSEDGCGGGGFYPWWNFNTFIPHGSSTMAINLDTPEVVSIASDISTTYYIEKNALQYEEQWINSAYNTYDYTPILLQICANIANGTVKGKGHVAGTLKHTAFAKYVSSLNNPFLMTEVSVKNGNVVSYHTKNSIRFDVLETLSTEKFLPFRAWDLKTGSAVLTFNRILRMQELSGLSIDCLR